MGFNWDDETERALALTPMARRPHREMPLWMLLVLILGPVAVVWGAWWVVRGYLVLVIMATGGM